MRSRFARHLLLSAVLLLASACSSPPEPPTNLLGPDAQQAANRAMQTRSFDVPADACPGDFTSASADVSFKDIVGHDLTASGSAPLS